MLIPLEQLLVGGTFDEIYVESSSIRKLEPFHYDDIEDPCPMTKLHTSAGDFVVRGDMHEIARKINQ